MTQRKYTVSESLMKSGSLFAFPSLSGSPLQLDETYTLKTSYVLYSIKRILLDFMTYDKKQAVRFTSMVNVICDKFTLNTIK